MSFTEKLRQARCAHAANVRRTEENFTVLKKRVGEIHKEIPGNIDVHHDDVDIMNFCFKDDETIKLRIEATPFGFNVNDKFHNLDAAIYELAAWIAKTEREVT